MSEMERWGPLADLPAPEDVSKMAVVDQFRVLAEVHERFEQGLRDKDAAIDAVRRHAEEAEAAATWCNAAARYLVASKATNIGQAYQERMQKLRAELDALRQKCLPIPPILFAFIDHARRGALDKLAIDPETLDDIAMEAELALAHAADVLAPREPQT